MTMTKPRIAIVTVWAENVTETAQFYRNMLELPLSTHHGTTPHFNLANAILVIQPGETRSREAYQETHFPEFAILVDDLDEFIMRLEAHGIDLPWGVESRPGSRWIQFFDPAGNLIELVAYD
jgi:catechol 2,3-dioxygenase-like lactoylglutathione lyase family enzyme